VQPTTTAQNRPITPAVEVSALDDGGNVATAFTGDITVAIGHDASVLHNANLAGVRTLTLTLTFGLRRG